MSLVKQKMIDNEKIMAQHCKNKQIKWWDHLITFLTMGIISKSRKIDRQWAEYSEQLRNELKQEI